MQRQESARGRGRHRRSGQLTVQSTRRAAFARAIEPLEPRRLLSTTVDFESLSVGPVGDAAGVYDDPSGFRFVFHQGLSAERQRFVAWKGHGWEEVALPAVGASIVLPAVNFDAVLAGPK